MIAQLSVEIVSKKPIVSSLQFATAARTGMEVAHGRSCMEVTKIAAFMDKGGNKVKIHILKKINNENYIGGDDTAIVHLKTANLTFEIQEGHTYLFIKPNKNDDKTITLNSKFKPIKTSKIHVDYKSGKVDEFVQEISIQNTDEGHSGESFETISRKADNTKLHKMTVRCLSTSRIITTAYGEYRIAKLRDFQNETGDINLNKHTKNKMESGKVYHIETFKVSNYKAPEAQNRRLATLPTTVIKKVSEEEEWKYRQIRFGDEEGDGVCIGIGNIHGYEGCSNCWKKVEEGKDLCCHCGTPTETATKEFSAEIYLEMDEEVITMQGFRRHFPMTNIESIDPDEIEDKLEKSLVGKSMKVEFNEGENPTSKKLIKINSLAKID